ncbi:MAG: hypothetical protein RLZZ46_1429 [Bacteroidota bacterium]|jgi:hypothetical protein
MKTKHLFSLFFIAMLPFVQSCAPKREKKEKLEKYEMNFEPSEDWQNLELTRNNTQAHSGKNVCELDSTKEFSITFLKKLSAFAKGSPAGLKVGMWVRLDDVNKSTALVMSVENEGKVLQWESMNLKPIVKKPIFWTEVSTLFNIKPGTPNNATLKVYLWNEGKQHLLIDDVVIKPQY